MTYRQLLYILINKLSVDKLDQDVTIALLDDQEVFKVVDFAINWDKQSFLSESYEEEFLNTVEGTLDYNHPVLIVHSNLCNNLPSLGERDFEEDSHLENGDYLNRCCYCNEVFIGYKRRVVCKICKNKE